MKRILIFVLTVSISFLIGAIVGAYLTFSAKHIDCQQEILTKYNCYEKQWYQNNITNVITNQNDIINQKAIPEIIIVKE